MHDALFVRIFQPQSHLTRDFGDFVHRERALCQACAEVLALGQLHDQEALTPILFKAVDRGDVGVIQGSKDFRLAAKTRQPFRIAGQIEGKELEGNLTIERGVARTPDFAHAALTDFFQDLVVREGFADHRIFYSRGEGGCLRVDFFLGPVD